MVSQEREEVDQTTDLNRLSKFLAKQHDRYLEMLQEPIDNAVSATVKSEEYFRDPEPVQIQIDLERRPNTVRAIVADEGPGMDRETIRDIIFQTANEEASDGILNNMGAGLKASIAWCQDSLKKSREASFASNAFHILSRTGEDQPIQRVDGPIRNEMEVYNSEDQELWSEGASELNTDTHGTRVHLTAARGVFDDDVARRASKMSMKVSYIVLVLGIRFRRLLNAHEENSITLTYRDIHDNDVVTSDVSMEVPPVDIEFKDQVEFSPSDMADYDSFEEFSDAVANLDLDEEAKYGFDTTSLIDDRGVEYHISYEYGNIDLEAMAEEVDADENNFTVTTGGNNDFRYRYKIATSESGVDIYANGRVLETQDWPFDIVRHPTLNRFNGVLRIEPASKDHEVPTNNEKTGIDKTSSLWQELRQWLNEDTRKPSRRAYDWEPDEDEDEDDEATEDSAETTGDEVEPTDDPDSVEDEISSESTGEESTDDSDSPDDEEDSASDDEQSTDDSDETEEAVDSTEDNEAVDDSESTDETDSESDDEETSGDDKTDSERENVEALITNLEESVRDEDSLQSDTEIDGGHIDLIHEQADGPTNLYKLVENRASPNDIYEMMMYQDHFKRSGAGAYGQTILLCKELTDEAESDFENISQRTDDSGESYEFAVVTPEATRDELPWITE